MKKLSIILVTIVLCCSAFLFTSCDQAKTVENTDVIPSQYDLSKMEVGTTVDVYPPFRYKLLDEKGGEHIIKIKSFTITLLKKNQIHEDDLIEGMFSNYEVKLEVLINADYTKFLPGDSLRFSALVGIENHGFYLSNFDENSNVLAERTIKVKQSNIVVVFDEFIFD